MKNQTKSWLIAALILFVMGAVVFVALLWFNKWDFSKFSTEKLETNTFNLTEDFDAVSINEETADIVFLPSTDNAAKVVCFESIKQKHTVKVIDGVLKVNYEKPQKWYERIGIMSFSTPKITVYLPKESYVLLSIDTSTGDIKIPKNFSFKDIKIDGSTCDVECLASVENSMSVKISTGDIKLKEITAENLTLTTSTGKITASDITVDKADIKVTTGDILLDGFNCKVLNSSGSTGDMALKRVIAENKLNIKRDTGDVKLEACDGGEIFIETSTGNVKGSLLSDKVFIAKSYTGRIKVPKTTSGGVCEITTDTGNIKLEIVN